jgi:hypothetical protein
MLSRRTFLQLAAGATLTHGGAQQSVRNAWGASVIDAHFHFRSVDAALMHMDGVGIDRVVLLTRAEQECHSINPLATGLFDSAD